MVVRNVGSFYKVIIFEISVRFVLSLIDTNFCHCSMLWDLKSACHAEMVSQKATLMLVVHPTLLFTIIMKATFCNE